MDEYIPQLTLTPDLSAQAQPEVKKEEDLITKAQAAPEAGPDLSALSPAEQQAVLSFAKQIDLETRSRCSSTARPRRRTSRTSPTPPWPRSRPAISARSARCSPACSWSSKRSRSRKEGHRGPVPQGKDQFRGAQGPLLHGRGQRRPHLRGAGKAQGHAFEGRGRHGSDV